MAMPSLSKSFNLSKKIAVVGTGPAALMAASVLSERGFKVQVFEALHAPARKLLIAGKSGLNLAPFCEKGLLEKIEGPYSLFKEVFLSFDVKDWLAFANNLGIKTFLGTSDRYFVEGLKAAKLLKAWHRQLKHHGVDFFYNHELTDYESTPKHLNLIFNHNCCIQFDGAVLALGGLSWPKAGHTLDWRPLFIKKNILISPVSAGNAAFLVDWSPAFLKEACGKPLKNILLKAGSIELKGELFITQKGIEGTPVYHLAQPQKIYLDLKPDLSLKDILSRYQKNPKKLSPFRWAQKNLALCEASLALLYHEAPLALTPDTFFNVIKSFPLLLKAQDSLETSISMRGGISFENLNPDLSLKSEPRLYLAGEMLDWHAPTGGYLIQTCVSLGHYAATKLVQKF